MEYELSPTPPSVNEYVRLRAESGLSPKTPEQAALASAGSWAFHRALDETGATVAMGRVLGDGGWYFHLADMATLLAHQRRGLGRHILDALVAEIRDRAPAGAYITLLADPPGVPLYRAAAFVPTTATEGMRLP
ncbi:GNAT family N-acetyltransferase [Pseudolysinimonas sp.]